MSDFAFNMIILGISLVLMIGSLIFLSRVLSRICGTPYTKTSWRMVVFALILCFFAVSLFIVLLHAGLGGGNHIQPSYDSGFWSR